MIRLASPTQMTCLKLIRKVTILPCCHGYVILQATVLTDFNVKSWAGSWIGFAPQAHFWPVFQLILCTLFYFCLITIRRIELSGRRCQTGISEVYDLLVLWRTSTKWEALFPQCLFLWRYPAHTLSGRMHLFVTFVTEMMLLVSQRPLSNGVW